MRKPYFILFISLMVGTCWMFNPVVGQANQIYHVTMDTQPLIGHPAGPFSLGFQLNDGSGPSGNNTAILSNFQFGGGSALGDPTVFGDASGKLTSSVVIKGTYPSNGFYQEFTPGTLLSFTLETTTNMDIDLPPTPDQFSFAILDHTLAGLPTLAPALFDVFMIIDIDSSMPVVKTFSSDPSRNPYGGGKPIEMDAPVIPTPGTLALLLVGLGGLLRFGKRHAH